MMKKQEIIDKLYVELSIFDYLKLDKTINNHIYIRYKDNYSSEIIDIFQKYAKYDIRIKRISEADLEKEDVIFFANYVTNKNRINKCLFLY